MFRQTLITATALAMLAIAPARADGIIIVNTAALNTLTTNIVILNTLALNGDRAGKIGTVVGIEMPRR